MGVFATAPIRRGESIAQLKGTIRTHDDAEDAYYNKQHGHTFLFHLNDEYVVDAGINGNISRWINHSCNPNCEALIEEDASGRRHKDRILIEAIRDIAPGEELTYDYGIEFDVPYTAKDIKQWPCRCGAPNCTGTMLRTPGKNAGNPPESRKADRPRPHRRQG